MFGASYVFGVEVAKAEIPLLRTFTRHGTGGQVYPTPDVVHQVNEGSAPAARSIQTGPHGPWVAWAWTLLWSRHEARPSSCSLHKHAHGSCAEICLRPGPSGSVELTATSVYKRSHARIRSEYGPGVGSKSCSSDKPSFFLWRFLKEYRVTVVLGGNQASTNDRMAEARRLCGQ